MESGRKGAWLFINQQKNFVDDLSIMRLCCQDFTTYPLLEKEGASNNNMALIPRSKESTAACCPYCKHPMLKLWENSKYWHRERCSTIFDEGSFINKI
ncbi:hypothetical protein Ngar_c15910 [Candidatus Nitrososphaera gargensis Ga9.2]|uniref:Uncharacterized protein n=1 Tax=Nitrososphaera gargensis (strain Ga9.2) TaxID=1237085 RepID=K0IN03_NITGG|nr:hypothetical protein Ngar_c15910 [Candidatus Nitrososphaera gargensis Ga9.2]